MILFLSQTIEELESKQLIQLAQNKVIAPKLLLFQRLSILELVPQSCKSTPEIKSSIAIIYWSKESYSQDRIKSSHEINVST